MSGYQSFDKLIINFNTGPLPPPFCHRYTIKIEYKGGAFSISLNLEYYDRDEITEEEIFDEGFTLDDDFTWEGDLPEIWGQEIKRRLMTSNWIKSNMNDIQNAPMELRISSDGRSEILYPADQNVWEVLAQEIMQAVFELAKKEAPLEIQFVSIEGKNKNVLSLAYQFADRLVLAKSSSGNTKKIDWKGGQQIMKHIYFFDYMPENGRNKLPKKNGDYIDPGDGLWYSLSAIGTKTFMEKKEQLVDSLKSYF